MIIPINATLVNLSHVCRRECWLHANGIRMEHSSDTVYDGKLLHEQSYPQRAGRYTEIELSGEWEGIPLAGKIDFYDATKRIIHETKRSDKVEAAHTWQLKYYIWLFDLNGVKGVTGVLEYPKLKQVNAISCSENDKGYLKDLVKKIGALVKGPCPPNIRKKICKSCSYYELCYTDNT